MEFPSLLTQQQTSWGSRPDGDDNDSSRLIPLPGTTNRLSDAKAEEGGLQNYDDESDEDYDEDYDDDYDEEHDGVHHPITEKSKRIQMDDYPEHRMD